MAQCHHHYFASFCYYFFPFLVVQYSTSHALLLYISAEMGFTSLSFTPISAGQSLMYFSILISSFTPISAVTLTPSWVGIEGKELLIQEGTSGDVGVNSENGAARCLGVRATVDLRVFLS